MAVISKRVYIHLNNNFILNSAAGFHFYCHIKQIIYRNSSHLIIICQHFQFARPRNSNTYAFSLTSLFLSCMNSLSSTLFIIHISTHKNKYAPILTIQRLITPVKIFRRMTSKIFLCCCSWTKLYCQSSFANEPTQPMEQLP